MRTRWIVLCGLGAAVLTIVVAVLIWRGGDDDLAATGTHDEAVAERTDLSAHVVLRDAVVVQRARYATRVASGDPNGAEATGLLVRATVPPELLYRFVRPIRSVQVQLVGGPGPQLCAPLGWAGAAASPGRVSGGVVVCRLRPGTQVVPGQPGTMAIALGIRRNVLTLPVEAVAGTVQEGQVRLIRPGGGIVDRSVGLGPSDGARVEITSGLRPGDRVALPAPDLPGLAAGGS